MNVNFGDNALNDSEYVDIVRLICAIDAKTVSIRDAKRDLLTIAASMQDSKASVVEGVANLLTKLPRNRLLDSNKIGEVELQSTYYDALLSELIADQGRNVALRWANKSDIETDIRPDAIISTLVQHDLGHSIGFGEVKAGNDSTNKHSVCMDVVRLGIACKRAIDQAHLAGCIAFLVNGFHLSFFMVRKEQHRFYTMTEIASLAIAPSLSDLHTFLI
ncbi:hypothetical protein DM01DRAFT_252186 [Hesseltinella vesiculosa]|uniref:Uncharacterized protein n=1 Tax=Hesseltinella vesiculosa TaxID=101127 RepID=A0A1X2G5D4_9FUNG|nr:hypothetical protein DM01DRAFT_252186 [Hesseltinella vesiculosa]